jgi:hypothetical protein
MTLERKWVKKVKKMSTKNNKNKTTRQLWNNFIKSEIILFEKNKALNEIKYLEIDKDSLISKLTQISILKLASINASDMLKLTNDEDYLISEITILNNKIKDINLSLNKIIINIANAFTIDFLFKYFKLLLSLKLNVESFSKFCDMSTQNPYVLSGKTNVVKRVNIFDFLSDIKENSIGTTNFSNKSLSRIARPFSKPKKKFFRFRLLFKKVRALRKIKKTFIFSKKNKIKPIPFSFNFLSIFFKVTECYNNNLFKRIPLTKKTVLRNNLDFFYRLHRKTSLKIKEFIGSNNLNSLNGFRKTFKIFLRNFHQKPY